MLELRAIVGNVGNWLCRYHGQNTLKLFWESLYFQFSHLYVLVCRAADVTQHKFQHRLHCELFNVWVHFALWHGWYKPLFVCIYIYIYMCVCVCVCIYTSFWKMFQVYIHGRRRGARGSIMTRLRDIWPAVWIPTEAWISYFLQHVCIGCEVQSAP